MSGTASEPALHRPGFGISTNVGHANAQRIELRRYDLVDDLIGHTSYTETLLLTVTGRRPSAAQVGAVDAVLVSLVDHGMQPSALAARLTYSAAPDALQGALAAGVLGAGSSLLGSMEQAGKLLADIGAEVRAGTGPRGAAERAVNRILDDGRRVPGFGHGLHRDGDPRAIRLLEVASELGVAVEETGWLAAVGAAIEERTGRRLVVNATGAAATILLGVGIPWHLHRGLAIISRTAGLLAHIGEELDQPIAPQVRNALREASWLTEEHGPTGGPDA
ncbi:citryl-CoA lyase [Plantactinospora soyae]|uniref:citrate synthase (unknown stereospecificity) n=1 Tax=Plantactinospora soyae TaxID=1544732 RepID=A0A927QZX4_9ACTN|nr:citryl-CoA lyase [Plantactinospora soyae]MBE1489542.1 citrate synthase [Plantactinospora soyae]